MIKNVVDNSGDDSLFVGVVDDAFHGVRLATRGLTVGKYGAIIPAQYI